MLSSTPWTYQGVLKREKGRERKGERERERNEWIMKGEYDKVRKPGKSFEATTSKRFGVIMIIII